LRPRERYLSELINPAPEDVATPRARNLMVEELHERLSSPFYPLTFVLIAIAMLGQAQTTRQGRGQALVLAFVLATAARVSGLTVNNLVSVSPSAIPFVYAIPIGAALLAAVHASAGMRPRRTNTPWARMSLLIGDGMDRLRERWSARHATVEPRSVTRAHRMGASGR
jgi:lipopolysaccharide export system permease protein